MVPFLLIALGAHAPPPRPPNVPRAARLRPLHALPLTPCAPAVRTQLAEGARTKLALTSTNMAVVMLFAQPLILNWRPHWRFAYLIALSLGIKFTEDGFYTSDINDHLTNEFTRAQLLEGERTALMLYEFGGGQPMRDRIDSFRTGLLHVALDHVPMESLGFPHLEGVEGPRLHILVTDESPATCQLHASMVHQILPNARVHMCHRSAAPLARLAPSDARAVDEQSVHLLATPPTRRGPLTARADAGFLLPVSQRGGRNLVHLWSRANPPRHPRLAPAG